jgi:Zn ribbon nucleic-acid-binding protein
MILFKACPRCQTGDLSLSEDIYGEYVQCVQCGHVIYPKADDAVSQPEARTTFRRRIAA